MSLKSNRQLISHSLEDDSNSILPTRMASHPRFKIIKHQHQPQTIPYNNDQGYNEFNQRLILKQKVLKQQINGLIDDLFSSIQSEVRSLVPASKRYPPPPSSSSSNVAFSSPAHSDQSDHASSQSSSSNTPNQPLPKVYSISNKFASGSKILLTTPSSQQTNANQSKPKTIIWYGKNQMPISANNPKRLTYTSRTLVNLVENKNLSFATPPIERNTAPMYGDCFDIGNTVILPQTPYRGIPHKPKALANIPVLTTTVEPQPEEADEPESPSEALKRSLDDDNSFEHSYFKQRKLDDEENDADNSQASFADDNYHDDDSHDSQDEEEEEEGEGEEQETLSKGKQKKKKKKQASKKKPEQEGDKYEKPPKYKLLSLKCRAEGCQQYLPTRRILNKHLMDSHSIKPYRCVLDDCAKFFETRFVSFLIMLPFKLTYISYFCYSGYLRFHYKEAHKDVKEWPCSKCNRSQPKNSSALYSHNWYG